MRILITQAQFLLGGTETYAVTVAEQLERLGHETRIHAGNASAAGRELIASRGLELTVGPAADLAAVEDVDAVIAQDAASAYALAARRSDLPQVFVVHGVAAFEYPPAALDPSPPVVVMSDLMERYVASRAVRPRIERLRQPIDVERFRPRGPARERPRRVLASSNYMEADRIGLLAEVCVDLGLELDRVGGAVGRLDPQGAIAAADIVVGYGRSVLEGLAMGRAAYVWDRAGGDGWVTPETYPTIEGGGFAGHSTDLVIDAARMRADFEAYRPEWGMLGFDLVRREHSAKRHAQALLDLLAGAEPPRSAAANATISLLVRAETRAVIRAEALEAQARRAREDCLAAEARAAAAEAEARAEREARIAAEGLAEARRAELDSARVAEAERLAAARSAESAAAAKLQEVLTSRSWRALEPLRRLAARLRRRPAESRDS